MTTDQQQSLEYFLSVIIYAANAQGVAIPGEDVAAATLLFLQGKTNPLENLTRAHYWMGRERGH